MSTILRVEKLTKSFPGVLAVDHVSFSLEKGEVLALLGENGAGKSTITKMICGALQPDFGKIYLDNQKQDFDTPNDAMHAGIGMVYQELSMVGSMSVAENIFMNRQPTNKLGQIKWDKLYKDTEELLKKFKLQIEPSLLVKKLSVGKQQLLEVLKAISFEPKILILDEPTSSLTDVETALLFENIKELKKEGYSFIYITHKLSEVFEISDKVMIMRDGQYITEDKIENVTENQIICNMVGREIEDLYGEEHSKRQINKDYIFEVKNLTCKGLYEDISFGVKKGEIIGFAGLIGAGRTEAALGIFGTHKKDSGEIFVEGKQVNINDPKDAIANKIAYLTEDRKAYGLYLKSSLAANLIATNLKEYSSNELIKQKKVDAHAAEQIDKFRIASPSIRQKVNNLSGGNQQKVLVSMWMNISPKVLIIDEPTRGVDVGAKAEIYHIVKDFASEGRGVVVISSEMPELIGLCDRIIVMKQGRIMGELKRDEICENEIIALATGVSSCS